MDKLLALIRKLGLRPGDPWWPLAGVAFICLLLGFGSEEAREWGRYERGSIEAGQIWRLVTGHLVHSGWSHLWLNLAALALLAVIFDGVLSTIGCLRVLLFSMIGIDAGLYLLQPQVAWYVGLSGVLHGVIAAGSLSMLGRYQTRTGLIIAVALAGKLGFEQAFGPLPLTQSASGGSVVVSAHLYGAIGGAIAVVPSVWHLRFAPRS